MFVSSFLVPSTFISQLLSKYCRIFFSGDIVFQEMSSEKSCDSCDMSSSESCLQSYKLSPVKSRIPQYAGLLDKMCINRKLVITENNNRTISNLRNNPTSFRDCVLIIMEGCDDISIYILWSYLLRIIQ